MKLVYLASPYLLREEKPDNYNHMAWKDHCFTIQHERYQKAIDATAYLMKKGLCVYSPIVATHPVAVKHELPLGSEFWLQYDEILLAKCDEIVVLMIDGWKESPGVQREIEIMKNLHKDITYLEPKMIK